MSKPEMPTPQNSAIAIDYQPAMYQSVQPHDRLEAFNNIQILAKAAKGLMSFANGKVKGSSLRATKNEAVRAAPGRQGESARSCLGYCLHRHHSRRTGCVRWAIS